MNQSRIWLVVKPTVGLPLFLGTVLVIALLVHGAVLTHTTWFPAYWNGKAGRMAPVAVAEPTGLIAPAAAPPAAAVASTPVAQPEPTPPLAKLYFDPDTYDKWVEGGESLDGVSAYLKSHDGARAAISGYHDPSGDAKHNMELSKKRAFAVRDALVAAGISADRLVLDKPMETTGSSNVARDGRRVEVSIRQ